MRGIRFIIAFATAATSLACAGCQVPFVMMSVAAASEGAGYFWHEQRGGPYYAAEGGRTVRLVPVTFRERGHITWGWGERLVEPCDSAPKQGPDAELPCWPRRGRGANHALLARVDHDLPAHRDTSRLTHAAALLNREVGSFRTAYVVGTRPLAVAFLDEAPDLESYQKLSGPQPWPPPEGTRGVDVRRWKDGGLADVADYRKRDARLVAEADLVAIANVVLMYPDDLSVEQAEFLMVGAPQDAVRARLVVLARPATVSQLIDAAADPQALARDARLVVDLFVR